MTRRVARQEEAAVLIVFVVVGAVVLFAIAAAAVGRLDGLEPTVREIEWPYLPTGTITAAHVDELDFAVGWRGYRMDQVDEVLDRLSAELTTRDEYIAALERTLQGQPEPTKSPWE